MFILDRFHLHPDKMCFLSGFNKYLLPPSLPSSALGSKEIAEREGEKEEAQVGGSEREHGLDVAILWNRAVPGVPTVQLSPKLTFSRRASSLWHPRALCTKFFLLVLEKGR